MPINFNHTKNTISPNTGRLIIDNNGSGLEIAGDGTTDGAGSRIKLNDSNNTHGIVLMAPPHSQFIGTYSLVLPANGGSEGQVLTTNGFGQTSWTTPSGGGITATETATLTNKTFQNCDLKVLHQQADFAFTVNTTVTLNFTDAFYHVVEFTNASGEPFPTMAVRVVLDPGDMMVLIFTGQDYTSYGLTLEAGADGTGSFIYFPQATGQDDFENPNDEGETFLVFRPIDYPGAQAEPAFIIQRLYSDFSTVA